MPTESQIAAVRRFNRFYTQQLGLLDRALLESPFTLAEARVLYELAYRGETTAAELGPDLGLDPGYLSRILRGFQAKRLITRRRDPDDARRTKLALSPVGLGTFAEMDARSDRQVQRWLDPLSTAERRDLTSGMASIERALGRGARAEATAPFTLRTHGPGDLGWLVERHGAVYAREYGWDSEFEALVAELAAGFLRNYQPERERCWIAEVGAERAGCVFLVRHLERPGVARLRCLLVESWARGMGIGARLVRECTLFARAAGYERLTLWTNDVLVSARRLYEAEGYVMVEERAHRSFGRDLVAQTWELPLGGASVPPDAGRTGAGGPTFSP